MGQVVIGADGSQNVFPDNATPEQMQAALAGSTAVPKGPSTAIPQRGYGAVTHTPTNLGPVPDFLNTYLQTPARRAAADLLGAGGSASQGLAMGTGTGPINKGFQALTLGPAASLGYGPLTPAANMLHLPSVQDMSGLIGRGQDAPTWPGRVAQTAVEGGIASAPFAGAGITPAIMGGISGGAQQGAKEADLGPLAQQAAGLLPIVLGGGLAAAKFGAKALGLVSPQSVMQDKILTALTNDGLTPQAALIKFKGWQAQGAKPEALIDLGGDATRRLARSVYTTAGGSQGAAGGPASVIEQNLAGRGDDRLDRVVSDFNSTARNGAPMQNVYDETAAIKTARNNAADPNYQAAYAASPLNPDAIAPGGKLADILQRPSMQAAAKNALGIAAEEGVNPNSLGIEFDASGAPKFTNVPSWQTLDYIKRGLDDVLEKYRDTTTGKLVLDTKGRAVNQTLQDFNGFLKIQNPAYAKALSEYSGPTQTINAITQGRSFLTQDPEVTTAQLAKLGPADQDAFRLGAARALQDKMGGAGGTSGVMSAYSGGPRNVNMRARIQAVFGDDATYQKFAALAQRESTMAKNENFVLSGSQTANKAQDVSGVGSQVLEAGKAGLTSVITGHPDMFIKYLLDKGSGMVGRAKGITPEVARLLAPILSDPQSDITGLLGALTKRLAIQSGRPGFLNNYVVPSGIGLLGGQSRGQ